MIVTDDFQVSPSELIYPPASDVAISDGKILCIGNLKNVFKAEKVIDAKGAYITPGGVDTHVHLDQGSLLNGAIGDTFEGGTLSAIAGGTTTIIAFAFQAKTEESVLPIVEAYHGKVKTEWVVRISNSLI
jgi:dihydropyrimidinase